MDSPHYRKIDLQSPADLPYLHANTLSLSRQKLDLHFPPSASASTARDNDGLDPMRERVRELVDDVRLTPPNLSLRRCILMPCPIVHHANLQHRNTLALHQRPRRAVGDSSRRGDRHGRPDARDGRVRAVRYASRRPRHLAVCAAGVADDGCCAVEAGCACAGGGGVCGFAEEGCG
jgi:hypothetical protein